MVVRGSLSLKRSFAGIVESFRAIGFMELDDSHGTFVTYFRIIMGDQYSFHAAQYMCPKAGRFFLKNSGFQSL